MALLRNYKEGPVIRRCPLPLEVRARHLLKLSPGRVIHQHDILVLIETAHRYEMKRRSMFGRLKTNDNRSTAYKMMLEVRPFAAERPGIETTFAKKPFHVGSWKRRFYSSNTRHDEPHRGSALQTNTGAPSRLQ